MGLPREIHIGTTGVTAMAFAITLLMLSSSIGSGPAQAASGVVSSFYGEGPESAINFTKIGGQENLEYSLKLPKESNVLEARMTLESEDIFVPNQVVSYKSSNDWRSGIISKDGDIPTLVYDTDGLHFDMESLAPFWPAEKKSTGNNPWDVVVGRFNNDNRDDFATANSDSDSVTIFYQDAQGKFGSSKDNVMVSDTPKSMDVGDFNNDGLMDIVVGCEGGKDLNFLYQKSTGGFSVATHDIGAVVSGVATGDLNGDGLDDVAVATDTFFGYTVTQNATGGFKDDLRFTVGELLWGYYPMNVHDVAVADLDGDKDDDIVFTICWYYNYNWEYELYGTTKIFSQTSKGAFSNTKSLGSGTGSFHLTIGDLNSDNRPDIVVSKYWVNSIYVYYQTSTGWKSPQRLSGGGEVHRTAIADFDSDGKSDLVAAVASPAVLFFRQEDVNGDLMLTSMSKKFPLPDNSNGRSVAAGQLDLDGHTDAVAVDGSGHAAQIFIQRLVYDGVFVSNSIDRPLPIRYVNFTYNIRPGGGTTEFFFSTDSGANWTHIVNATVYDLVNRTKSIWFKITFHSTSPSAYDAVREFRLNMTYQSYPSNLVLDIGDDNDKEWNMTGELIGMTQVTGLADRVTEFVHNVTHQPDSSGYVSIPIMFFSATPGKLTISNILIHFNNASRPPVLLEPPNTGFVNGTPLFRFYANDTDDDLLMYRLQITKGEDFSDGFNTMTFDMTKGLYDEEEGEGFPSATFRQGEVASFTLPEKDKLQDDTTYRWRVFAFDGYLWSRASTVHVMKVDSFSPIGHATTDKYSTTLEFNVTWLAQDVLPGSGLAKERTYDVQYRKSTETFWTDWLLGTTLTSSSFTGEEGVTYYFRMRARDAVLNEQLYIGGKGDTQITVDTQAPEIEWALMPSFQDTRSFLLRWIATDYVPGSGIRHFIVETHKEQADWSTLVNDYRSSQTVFQADADTTYSFRVRGFDNAGNVGEWSEVFTVRIDATAPVLIERPRVPLTDGVWSQLKSIILHFGFVDSESGIRSVEVGIGTDKGLYDVLSPTSFPYPDDGVITITDLNLVNSERYYVGVRAENFAGAWSPWAWSDEFTVAIPGPVSTVSYPTGTVVDTRIQISIDVSDPRDYNITLGDLRMRYATHLDDEWTWSDWERISNARDDTLYEGKRGFRYQFMFRAQNELGSWGAFYVPGEDQWLFINNPPVANGGPSKVSNVGKDIQFSADQSQDLDGDSLTYEWDFGDGTNASGLYTSHSYGKKGLYTVTLIVSDGHDVAVARTAVYVEADESAPGFGGGAIVLAMLCALGISVVAAGRPRKVE